MGRPNTGCTDALDWESKEPVEEDLCKCKNMHGKPGQTSEAAKYLPCAVAKPQVIPPNSIKRRVIMSVWVAENKCDQISIGRKSYFANGWKAELNMC
jgi:hypothetical protein